MEMEWIVNNWYLPFVFLVVLAIAAIIITKFYYLPTKEQIKNIKEWLLYAVTEAEKQFGTGTGKLKLRQVYDWAVIKFPCLQFVKFEVFSKWVDEALEIMRELLKKNQTVLEYIEET